MDPGQEQRQHGDQLEALPVDGSPMLGGHSDNVSEDQGNSSCRSPPDSVDCITSSSEVQVGNDCTSSCSDSCTTSSSLIVDPAYAASQLPEVIPPTFKFICEIGMVQKPQEGISPLTSLESTRGLDKQEEPILSPEDPRPIVTLQHHQVGMEGDTASLTSGHRVVRKATRKVDAAKEDDLSPKINFGTVIPSSFKFTCGLEKQEEPILCPEDFRSMGTSQHYHVGLDAAHVTSVTGKNRKRTKGSGAEEAPPAKKTRASPAEEDPPAKKTRDSAAEEEPSAKRTRENQAEDDLPSKRTRFSGAEEELPSKKPRDSVAEEEFPAKRTRVSGLEEELPSKKPRDSVAEEEFPAKRTRDSGDGEEEIPAKRSRDSNDEEEPHEDPVLSSPVLSPSGWTVHDDSSVSSIVFSQSSLTYLEDPILSPVFSSSPKMVCEDSSLSSPVLSPSSMTYLEDPILSPVFGSSPTMSWEDPIRFSPVPSLSLSPSTYYREPLWSSSDLSLSGGTEFWMGSDEDIEEDPTMKSSSPTVSWEDPVLFSPVPSLSLSPSTYSGEPLWSSSELSFSGGTEFWMGSDEDIEEDPIPSTSDGITRRQSSRPLWFRPHYDLSSDSETSETENLPEKSH